MSDRRRFLTALAATPLLPAALAQKPPAPPQPVPSPSAAPPGAEAAAREAVADELTDAARRIFGDRFPEAQARDVRDAIAENLRAGERLKALAFGNGDEPVTVFAATARPSRTGGGTGQKKR